MIRNISPLRYPGGKKKLTPFLASIIEANYLGNSTYVEPFAGGAGAALNLLVLEFVNNIIINDADYCIYCFWKAVLNESERLAKRIRNVKVSIFTWKKQRKIIEDAYSYAPFDVGFAAFFLNRCNRSGIIDARPIGGMNQKGDWKLSARFNRIDLIDRIKLISLYRDRIQLYNLDAIKLLEHLAPQFKSDAAFVYLDPPYYVEGKNLYLNYYSHEDHVKLSSYIQRKLKYPWVLSYDDVKEIRCLYQGKLSVTYKLSYSANKVKSGKEIMFFSDRLRTPDLAIWV